jgi:RNA 3'-terminal phosphate cyclase
MGLCCLSPHRPRRQVRGVDVACGVAAEVRAHLDAGVPVAEHLAGQLLILTAIAGGGAIHTTEPMLRPPPTPR